MTYISLCQFKTEHVFLAVVLMLLSACGGGGGESSDAQGSAVQTDEAHESGDTIPPSVRLTSPKASRATTNREVIITGSANDQEGHISNLFVNGIAAKTENGFADWSASVPVKDGIPNITIVAEDASGNTTKQQYDLQFSAIRSLFSQPSDLSYESSAKVLHILDRTSNILFSTSSASPSLSNVDLSDFSINKALKIDFDATNRRLLILDQRKTRPASQALIALSEDMQSSKLIVDGLQNTTDFAVSEDGKQVFFLSTSERSRFGGTLNVLNLDNGQINVISDSSNRGPSIETPAALAITTSHAFYVERSRDELVSVDLSSGIRTVVSARGANNLAVASTEEITLSPSASFAWATNVDEKYVLSINLGNGVRKIVSSPNLGQGVEFGSPRSLVFDPNNRRLLIADTDRNIIIATDVFDGSRDYFISNRIGNGPTLRKPTAIDVMSSERAVVFDQESNNLFEINLLSGDRRVISEGSNSNLGPLPSSPKGLAASIELNKAWVTDQDTAKIYEIDLGSGERIAMQANTTVAGNPQYKMPSALAIDGSHLYVSDIYHDIIQTTHITSGETVRASYSELSDGTQVKKATGIAMDSNDRILGVDQIQQLVFFIDKATGTSGTLSSINHGSGINFLAPKDIEAGPGQSGFVLDTELNAIIQVDLTNGDRSVLSNRVVGSGPEFRQLSDLSFEKQSNTLFALDAIENAVFAIDPNTGERSILSR